MSFDYMNPLVHDRFNHVLPDHESLFSLASISMNRTMFIWFQNQYNIANDADAAFNDFMRLTIMGVIHTVNRYEYTCCIRLLSIISMISMSVM